MTDQIATAESITFADDFMQHRIQGTAHQDEQGRFFDIPLVSHVEGNLYQGGCFGGVRLPDEFVYVASLYPWERYELGPDTHRDEFKLYDASDQGFEFIDAIAKRVVGWAKDGPTLVHCQAGLNRSGLVAARALMLMNGDSAAVAINKVRKRSPVVLCNQSFVNWLHGLD